MFWFCFVQCRLQCKHFMLRSQCRFEGLTMYDHVSHPSHGDCRQRHFILQLPEDGWTTLNLFRKMLNLVRPFSTQKVDVFFQSFLLPLAWSLEEELSVTFTELSHLGSSFFVILGHLGSSWVILGRRFTAATTPFSCRWFMPQGFKTQSAQVWRGTVWKHHSRRTQPPVPYVAFRFLESCSQMLSIVWEGAAKTFSKFEIKLWGLVP